MSLLLNRKKSFGTVYGDAQIGYEQDGLMFRHDGSLHGKEPVVKAPDPAPTAEAFPTAAQIPESPKVLSALEALSAQIKDLKPEVKPEMKGPDPARSEAARKIWLDRRAREAAAKGEIGGTSIAESATP